MVRLLRPFLEGTGASPGSLRMISALPAAPLRQVSRKLIAAPFQSDGAANTLSFLRDPSLPVPPHHVTSHSLSVTARGLLCPPRPLFSSAGVVTKPLVSLRDRAHNMLTTFNQSAASGGLGGRVIRSYWEQAYSLCHSVLLMEINSRFPLTLMPVQLNQKCAWKGNS